ncbi:MAG: DEAD/DEAH box helicase [Caldilineaceae bacterium]|nr:DEAD/DEAH box helicase [Caldilineaceae bacterium]
MPFVLHAAWLRVDGSFPDGRLFFWADDSSRTLLAETLHPTPNPSSARASNTRQLETRSRSAKTLSHPSQISVGQLRAHLRAAFPHLDTKALTLQNATAWLPSYSDVPNAQSPTPPFKSQTNPPTKSSDVSAGVPFVNGVTVLKEWQITGLALPPAQALHFLCQLDQHQAAEGQWGAAERQISDSLATSLRFGNDLLFWSNAAKYTLQLLAGQQYLPVLLSPSATRLQGGWQPILSDTTVERQFEQLRLNMPPICRAYDLTSPATAPSAAELLNHFVTVLLDAAIRHWANKRFTTVAPQNYAQQWLQSLVSTQYTLDLPPQTAHELYQYWRTWSEQLHITRDANFRIGFKLEPPVAATPTSKEDATPGANGTPIQLGKASHLQSWTLHYFLQARDHQNLTLPASAVWEAQNHALHLGSRLLDRPKERLMASLTMAARISPPIARSLQTPQPTMVCLSTAEAYTFLNETAPLLESSGFGIILPDWWYTSQRTRIGLRLRLAADDAELSSHMQGAEWDDAGGRHLRRGPGYVRYDWELMLGDQPLSRADFEQLAALDIPLVHLRNQWIELDPHQVAAAKRFFAEQQNGGQIPFLQALRIAQSHRDQPTNGYKTPNGALLSEEIVTTDSSLQDLLTNSVSASLPIYTVDADGWLAAALERLNTQQQLGELPEPEGFVGELRPYQRRGVGWLSYLGRMGLGACLADDMGLGKTIQSIALLLYDRAMHNGVHAPSLLLCPTSVVANWRREVERFAPSLRILVHHGSGRLTGQAFVDATEEYDLVVTSYGTARRDLMLLEQRVWSNLLLDEAQNIKNPSAKQTQAVRRLQAENRFALTGTPVENRLAELWSIMEFLNPGYLDGYERFRRRYVIPIERYNDEQTATELRNLVQPFLLRRLKSDPTIIADLPEKNEMVVYCSLTQEQATLYEEVVSQSLNALDQSDGIQRRGMVLALLTKLKQLCNHPAHYLKESGPLKGRSGKLERITEMMEEVLAVGDSALVFTQFVEMGELLQRHFTEQLKADVLFLHGRISAAQRERMVQTFQESETPIIFILSLRAGGAGLNLTRANHVFHFDRWWNPAVENQATDRAFRIGQRRDVQVHKFVVAGTLEEHIQQLLDSKQNLADTIVGSGEQWLSELNTDQLRELLLLRREEADDGQSDLDELLDDFSPASSAM